MIFFAEFVNVTENYTQFVIFFFFQILPSLESYCIYAAVCVLMTFVFAVTFFTACFVLDQRRVENNHNGIIFCYKHKNYQPNNCSQRQTSHLVFNYIYDKFILTTTGKVLGAWQSVGLSYINIYKINRPWCCLC